MSDEINFHLDYIVSQQNCRYWTSEKKELHERLMHNLNVTVWCVVRKIVAKDFFEGNIGILLL